MRDYEHYALDPIGQFRRHPANAVWGEDGADRYLRSFPGDYAEWVEKQIEVDPYLSTPLREDLEDALDRFVERYRSGKVPPKDAWAGWWLQPREFARGMIRLEWELHYQRDLPGNRKATSEGRKATPIAKRDPAIQSDEERELQDDIQVYLSAVEGLEWWDTSRIGLSGYPDL
ncbi:MAG: hypothetical protein OXH38_13695, partial [Chloroflexi bacterium]|nr:hypothetical protein [Chloroflexota bacterium]